MIGVRLESLTYGVVWLCWGVGIGMMVECVNSY